MSYAKAMKHARNVRKCRAQANNHFGFDTGSGHWPSGFAHPYVGALMLIREWFHGRHSVYRSMDRKYLRECIREQVIEAREAKATMQQQRVVAAPCEEGATEAVERLQGLEH